MRSAVYVLAVFAALGIAYFLATSDPEPVDSAASGTDVLATQSHQVMTQEGQMTLRVEDMHCPFACYPAVKKSLESQPNVMAVELDEQKEEGVIDNPQVVVTYQSGFDLTAALENLATKGFSKSSVAN